MRRSRWRLQMKNLIGQHFTSIFFFKKSWFSSGCLSAKRRKLMPKVRLRKQWRNDAFTMLKQRRIDGDTAARRQIVTYAVFSFVCRYLGRQTLYPCTILMMTSCWLTGLRVAQRDIASCARLGIFLCRWRWYQGINNLGQIHEDTARKGYLQRLFFVLHATDIQFLWADCDIFLCDQTRALKRVFRPPGRWRFDFVHTRLVRFRMTIAVQVDSSRWNEIFPVGFKIDWLNFSLWRWCFLTASTRRSGRSWRCRERLATAVSFRLSQTWHEERDNAFSWCSLPVVRHLVLWTLFLE